MESLKNLARRSALAAQHLQQIWRVFSNSNEGNIGLVAALAVPILGLTVGSGLTVVDAVHRRSDLRDALDAAVLAGAAHEGDPEERIAAAEAYFERNRAPAIANAQASFQAEGQIISGSASMTMPTLLSGLLGRETLELGVEAAAESTSMSVCMLGLNGLDNGAFDINGRPDLYAPDCAVHANSGSSRAMTQEGNAVARAGLFSVRGGSHTNGFRPLPREGQERVDDPYANIPFMQHSSCNERNPRALDIRADVTLQPGTYCGGINITGLGVEVTMAPGEYVMVNGPLLVNGNAKLAGREVVIGFTGGDSTLRVWGNAFVDLTSPTSGAYANLQFFQDRDDRHGRGAWVSIGGNGGPTSEADRSKLTIDGAAYFPTQNFWVYGAAELEINSPGVSIVADKIWFQGAARIEVTTENRRGIDDYVQARVHRGARLVH